MSKIQCGDKLKVFTKGRRGWKAKECTVVEETEKFISVNYGLYPGCINKFDLKTGNVKIKRIEEENGMKPEAKITKEQLLEECKIYGTDKDAVNHIGEKYGLAPNTIKSYIQRWLTIEEKIAIDKSVENKCNEDMKKIEKVILSTAPKDALSLDIIGVTLSGENGTYTVCKEGIELKSEEQILSFGNVQQWEEFKAEIDMVFEYGTENKILAS